MESCHPKDKSQTQENESHRITKGMTEIENVGMGVKLADTRQRLAIWTGVEKSYWAAQTQNME